MLTTSRYLVMPEELCTQTIWFGVATAKLTVVLTNSLCGDALFVNSTGLIWGGLPTPKYYSLGVEDQPQAVFLLNSSRSCLRLDFVWKKHGR